MLRSLDIREMLIIDALELTFQPGLNVLTGETGAGKSILLDSLGFVLGWRGRAELVREGAAQGEVTAVFALTADHPARAVLQEAGLPEEDELILRRINARDGRKTAWVNDRRCSGEVLRALSETLVELHGQHDDRGLLNPRGHRRLLDEYGNTSKAQDQVRRTWKALAVADAALKDAQAKLLKLQEEEEFLRHAVGELDAMAPVAGEDAQLDVARRKMQGAEKLREDLVKALGAIGNDGAEGATGDATRWLEDVADQADGLLAAPIEALGRALSGLGEASDGVLRALEALSYDPHELENTEERLFALRALARKHEVTPDELYDLAIELNGRLAAVDRGADDIAALEQELAAATAAYDAAATKLTAARKKAALKLDKAVGKELAPLKMERAAFETSVSKVPPGATGRDEVTFLVATNPGAPSGPLGKIASGGELSRFLLALKVCLTSEVRGITMIFDEIDRGVGGATADAVGRRLAELAENGQVLVVTHSPQVAAQGAHHWQVAKSVKADQTLTRVVPLSEEERIAEIARMLSGDQVTDEARAAAKRLMSAG